MREARRGVVATTAKGHGRGFPHGGFGDAGDGDGAGGAEFVQAGIAEGGDDEGVVAGDLGETDFDDFGGSGGERVRIDDHLRGARGGGAGDVGGGAGGLAGDGDHHSGGRHGAVRVDQQNAWNAVRHANFA